MSAAIDIATAPAELEVGQASVGLFRSISAGHLAAQRALYLGGSDELLAIALAELGTDAAARAAFARSVARARRPA